MPSFRRTAAWVALFFLLFFFGTNSCSGQIGSSRNAGKHVRFEYPSYGGVSIQKARDTKAYVITADGKAIEVISNQVSAKTDIRGAFLSNIFTSCGEISGFSVPEHQISNYADPATGRYCCMISSGIETVSDDTVIRMISLPVQIRVPISGIPSQERLVSVELYSGDSIFTKEFISNSIRIDGEYRYSILSSINKITVDCPDLDSDFAFIDFCVIPAARVKYLLSGINPTGETSFTLNIITEKGGDFIQRQYTDLIIRHNELCSDTIITLLNSGNSFDLSADFQPRCTIDISSQRKQLLHFGVDCERLWYFWEAQRERLCQLAAGDMRVDYARVAINAAYEREEGNKQLSAYTDDILPLMRYLKHFNPDIKFFASPRPLKEAYDINAESELINSTFKNGDIAMFAYPIWVGGHKNMLLDQYKHLDREKMIRYLSDYLNLMHEYGFEIDYMDLVNEDQSIWENDIDNVIYVIENIPAHLNEGVKMPQIVFPSTWSPSDGFKKFLDIQSVASKKADVISKLGILSTHNTPDADINSFDFTNLKRFADAIHDIDPDKEIWNSEMHGWTGTKDPASDIRNSEVLWKHLIAGFSGIDTWLFFGQWNGAAHPMVYSNNNNSPVTTAKYEIFKTIVNEVCLGRYLSSVSSNQNVTSVAMSKNDRMVICLHNPSSEAINSIINLPKSTRINGDIAVHLWEESMKDIVPRVSSITNCNGTSSISIRIPCASLQILTMSVIQ